MKFLQLFIQEHRKNYIYLKKIITFANNFYYIKIIKNERYDKTRLSDFATHCLRQTFGLSRQCGDNAKTTLCGGENHGRIL